MSEAAKIKNGRAVMILVQRSEELGPDAKKVPKCEAYFYVTPSRARKMLANKEVERVAGKEFTLRLIKESTDVYKRDRPTRWTNVSGGRHMGECFGEFMNGIAMNRRF